MLPHVIDASAAEVKGERRVEVGRHVEPVGHPSEVIDSHCSHRGSTVVATIPKRHSLIVWHRTFFHICLYLIVCNLKLSDIFVL